MDGVGREIGEMDMLGTAARAMSVQRSLLDIGARNIAAAQASSPGHPYTRLVAELGADAGPGSDDDGDSADVMSPGDDSSAGAPNGIVGLRSEPGTGDALTEMIAVLDAQRAYEQNASIFDTAKRLAERTIDIGRS